METEGKEKGSKEQKMWKQDSDCRELNNDAWGCKRERNSGNNLR